jgi:hypothetical protein
LYVILWICGDGNRVKKIMNQNKEDRPTFIHIYYHLAHYIPFNFDYCTEYPNDKWNNHVTTNSMLKELVIISKYRILLISKHYKKEFGVNYNALFFR